MAILTLKSRYPFDPSGDDTVNFVGGERHELPVKGNRIIVPKQGAFYRRSLVIQRDGNEVLKEGVDYYLGGFYQEATAETGLEVNVVIVFDDRIQGNIYLSYQVVGGLYSGIFETIDEFIQALLVDPRKTRWDDILDKPEFYAPMPHLHDINDVYGMDYIIPVLEEIARSIRYLRHREFRKVYNAIAVVRNDMEFRIDGLSDEVRENNRQLADTILNLRSTINNVTQNTKDIAALRKLIPVNLIERVKTAETDIVGLKANINTIDNQLTTLNGYGNRIRNLESRQSLTAQAYAATGNGLTSPTDSKWKSECWARGKVVKLIDGEAWIGAVNLGNIRFRSSVSGVTSDKMKTRMFFDGEYLTIDKKVKATDFNMTSDKRLKENITPITQPLEKVNQLTGYTFNFLHDEQRSGGVIAQELIEVLPELVTKDDEGILSVKYNGLIALLIESVKALKNKNNELEEKLNQLLTKD